MNEKRYVVKEQSLKNLADTVREKTGTTTSYDIDEMVVAIDGVGLPEREEINITENGEYTPTKYGYSRVTVDVQPAREEINITENGIYTPTSYGFSKATVDVQPTLEELTVTANGIYTPTAYGYSRVTVNCPPGPPEESFLLKGGIHRLDWGGHWDWFFNLYGDKISTKDINNMNYSFSEASTITRLPFVFNLKGAHNLGSAFNSMTNLEECPKLRGTLEATTSLDCSNLIYGCTNLRDANDLFEPGMLDVFSTIKCTSTWTSAKPASLSFCPSLRSIPEWFYKFRLSEESTAYPYSGYTLYNGAFNNCISLDEALNIPVWKCKGAQTSNMFSSTASSCYRIKNFTFETDVNGQPIQTDWKSQVLDLSSVGFVPHNGVINLYNSGITKDKKVNSDATYQALKNDPDWYTEGDEVVRWSRYDHDSAVRTINSLPDTSAYLATAGGTNTIKFKGAAGSNTDGGAINTLTAEEIAVATAKGWTVTLV